MNAKQRQDIINIIDSFKAINIEELFISQYGINITPDNVSVGEYSISEFYSLTKRVFDQLEIRITQPSMWQMLPATQNFQNDFGSCDLCGYSVNLIAKINNKQYDDAIGFLKSLIYYQIANGFWDFPKKIDLGIKSQDLEKLETRTSLIAGQIKEKSEKLETLLNKAELLKDELNELKNIKTQEFDEIARNLTESKEMLTKVTDVQIKVNDLLTNIMGQEERCEKVVTDIEARRKDISQTQESINKQQKSQDSDFKSVIEGAEAKLITINDDYKYIEEKKDKVKEMMGYIADGTLSHSFNSRKKKIELSVKWWGLGSIGCGILMGAWIFVVFIYLQAMTDNVIVNMIINIAKTSPMIVLFWFSLSQYQKERNLLEEYAFRETIAVTLTAYLDQLEGETDEHKRSLLINTVERLYAKPKISSEGVGLFAFKSKDLVDLVKEVKETLVEIKVAK